MDIIKRLPDDIIRYTIEFVPDNHILNLYSFRSIYKYKKKSLYIIITFSLYNYMFYGKSHKVHIAKPLLSGIGQNAYIGMCFKMDHVNIHNLLIMPKKDIDILSTSFFFSKMLLNLCYFEI